MVVPVGEYPCKGRRGKRHAEAACQKPCNAPCQGVRVHVCTAAASQKPSASGTELLSWAQVD